MAKKTKKKPLYAWGRNEPLSGITHDCIVEKLEHRKKLDEGIHQYFRSDSLLWRAISDHIAECPLRQCAFFNKTHRVVYHRGTGPAISLKKVWIRPPGAYPLDKETIRFWFDVVFHNEDEETEYQESHMIDAPIDLLENFTEAKFQKWLKEQREKYLELEEVRAKRQMDELLRQYPYLKTKKKDS